MADDERKELLDRAFDGLERETPDRLTRAIRWVRSRNRAGSAAPARSEQAFAICKTRTRRC